MTKVCFFLLLLLVACGREQANPSPNDGGVGIPLAPQFAAVYDEFGGQRVLGEPITNAFKVNENGRLLQYFQAMRLEYDDDPDLAADQRIMIFPLGEWALAGLAEVVPVPTPEDASSRYFPETDESVQGEFLVFYEEYGDERVFGPPLSPELEEDGLRVQYFQNGRLEWQPELPRDQRVQVSHLGQAHFDAEMAFTYRRMLLAQPVPSAGLTNVDVYASIQAPILYAGDEQVIYVTVLTQEGRPVAGINAEVTVTHDSANEVLDLGPTDEQGRIEMSLDLPGVEPGDQVRLLVSVYSATGNVIGAANLSFKTWW
jgi:hypothetical protein